MKKLFMLTLLFLIVSFVAFAGTDAKIKGAHLENGMQCADCHGIDAPVKKASAKKCQECHGDMKDAKQTKFKNKMGAGYELNLHDSHAGTIRCTLCHASHKESALYCNSCHHSFQISVP